MNENKKLGISGWSDYQLEYLRRKSAIGLQKRIDEIVKRHEIQKKKLILANT